MRRSGSGPEIVFEADIDGKLTVEVNGVQGPSCKEMTEPLLRALKAKVVREEKKPEFDMVPGERVRG